MKAMNLLADARRVGSRRLGHRAHRAGTPGKVAFASADNGDAARVAAPRRDFLGAPIDCLTLAETIAVAERAIQSRTICQHICLNVAKFVAMRTNAELDRDVRSSQIVSVDGMGIVWAARLLGIDVPERVAGVDIMEGVIGLCAANRYRPFLLGGRPQALHEAVANLRGRFPGLELAGTRHGYFTTEEECEVVAMVNSSRADCLFIGLPTPRKERFLARHRDDLGVPFIMGVGGGLDILAGQVRRAPLFIRHIGLEWLFRAVQEPLRLGPRYLVTNAVFAGVMAHALTLKFLPNQGVLRSRYLPRRPLRHNQPDQI